MAPPILTLSHFIPLALPFLNITLYRVTLEEVMLNILELEDINYLTQWMLTIIVSLYGQGVRPVVYLKEDINLSGNSTDGWTIE